MPDPGKHNPTLSESPPPAAPQVAPRRLWWLLAVLLGLVGLLNVARAVDNTRFVLGTGDFYVYWYYGHFLWQGENPYSAYLAQDEPATPVTYLDGRTFTRLPRPWITIGATTYTAPLLMVLALFSRLSWFTAKWLWLGINLLLMLLVPLLAWRATPGERPLARWQLLLLLLAFTALSATRNTLGNGQTSLLVLALMLLALSLPRRQWLLAGLLTGLALGKYALALPLVLYFLVKGRWRLLLVALIVQGGALFVLPGPPVATLQVYAEVVRRQFPAGGVHLLAVYRGGLWLVVLGSILLWALLLRWWWRRRPRVRAVALGEWHWLAAVSLWTLLVAYHGNYDAVLLIIPAVTLLRGWLDGAWALAPRARRALAAGSGFALFVFVLPRTLSWSYPPVRTPIWDPVVGAAVTLTLVALTVALCWLLWRLPPIKSAPFR